MPRFGRNSNQRTERTAEQRERDRQERAARRAERQDPASLPEDDAAPVSAPAPPPGPPAEEEPFGSQPEPELAALPEREPAPEPAPEPEPSPEPEPVSELDPEPEPQPAREDSGATREFSAGELAEARGRTPRTADPGELDIDWQDAAHRGEPLPDRPLRRIQPEPAPPPPAPAGSLPDADRAPRPRAQRRTRNRRRGGAVMTPPGDVPRGPRTRGRRGPARIAALLALIIVIALILWFLNAFLQPFRGDGTGRVAVVIPQGAGAGKIGDVLSKAGVVDSGFLFSIRATLSGARGDLRSGRHVLRRDMSYGAAIKALSARPSAAQSVPVIKVTIPEGRSRREIRAIATNAGLTGSYLDATAKAPSSFSLRRYGAPRNASLEGFLFPATYDLDRGANVSTLVTEQLAAFKDNIAKVDMRTARRRNLTTYDVLIIASMVEREARVAKERPLIAAVIQHRLRENLPLGIDATIRFATNNWTQPLTESVLRRDSPYNTRLHRGLPPTPIGNPGLASIRAAANPSGRDYLYYVVKPGTCGVHAFSRTEAQFERDVARYNAARDAAGGKSPTKC